MIFFLRHSHRFVPPLPHDWFESLFDPCAPSARVVFEPTVQAVNGWGTFRNTGMKELLNHALFGPAAVTPAPKAVMATYVHSKILHDRKGWVVVMQRYTATVREADTCAYNHFRKTRSPGPESLFVTRLAALDASPYLRHASFSSSPASMRIWGGHSKQKLRTLPEEITSADEARSHALFLCAFLAAVNESVTEQGSKALVQSGVTTTRGCIRTGVN